MSDVKVFVLEDIVMALVYMPVSVAVHLLLIRFYGDRFDKIIGLKKNKKK